MSKVIFNHCLVYNVRPTLMELLHSLSTDLGENIVVTSLYRTEEHEKEMGRSGTSSHCKGLAADISCNNSNLRLRIVRWLSLHNVTRIGIAKTFIHFDIDDDKPDSLWLY